MSALDSPEALRAMRAAIAADPARTNERSADGDAACVSAIEAMARAIAAHAQLDGAQCELANLERIARALAKMDKDRSDRLLDAFGELRAVLAPGLSALDTIRRRGADSSEAARALWCEWIAARDALFALAGLDMDGLDMESPPSR